MERSARGQRTLSKQNVFDNCDETDTFPTDKQQEIEVPENDPASLQPVNPVNNNASLHRSRSQSKVRLLVRSHAVREEASPPPDDPSLYPTNNNINNNNNNNNNNNMNGSSLSANTTRLKLKKEGSSQGSIDSWTPNLSRDNSMEQYTDSSGIDLEQFIENTLNRNPKDRLLLLKIENELVSLIKDNKRSVHKFQAMSSYQRMLVHRVAAYFGMDHNVDPSGQQVVVNKTKATRLPNSKFCDLVRDDLLFPEEPRRSILKRDSSSFDETSTFKSHDRQLTCESRRSKSFEEREEEYEKVKRRIFNHDHERNLDSQNSSQDEDDVRWPSESQNWTSSDLENLELERNPPMPQRPERKSRIIKVESYESKDALQANSLRQSILKSYSFGGYDQQSLNARMLTKQDSGSSMSSRLSPSSSGYKSQSQRSDVTLSATPSPTATPQLATHCSSQSRAQTPELEQEREKTVMWAVTSLAVVPRGSIIINPQTGQPCTNLDGSIYHFDPDNPPKMSPTEELREIAPEVKPPSKNQTETGVKKKTPKISNPSPPTPTSLSTDCAQISSHLQHIELNHESSKTPNNVSQSVKYQPHQPIQQPSATPAFQSFYHPPQTCYPYQLYPTASGMPPPMVQPPPSLQPLPSEGMYHPVNPQQPSQSGLRTFAKLNQDINTATHDLTNYLMGLNMGDPIQNIGDGRSILYWPAASNSTPSHPPQVPLHVSQPQNPQIPVIYGPQPTNIPPIQYSQVTNSFNPMSSMMPMDRTDSSYMKPMEWQKVPPMFSQPVHILYNNNGHNMLPNPPAVSYCNNSTSNLMHYPSSTQVHQNHMYINNKIQMPTPPPTTNQQVNMYPQYQVPISSNSFNAGCYSLQTTAPSLLPPPRIQMGMQSNPPMTTDLREGPPITCPGPIPPNVLRYPNIPQYAQTPFYVTRLVPGDLRLVGNNHHRIGFPMPTSNTSMAARKSRPKSTVLDSNGSGPPPSINQPLSTPLMDISRMNSTGFILGP
uniref:cAMP-regulated phosphoprotein 21 n=2 Tax=Clastoptera arizonana TaxID=38151 RepID=A0A1B6DE93_9HEMI